MIDWLAGAKTAIGTGVEVFKAWRTIKKDSNGESLSPAERALFARRLQEMQTPKEVQLLPFTWEVTATADIPKVAVFLWLVNYRTKPLTLSRATVAGFQIEGVPYFDDIHNLEHITLPAKTSRAVYIRSSLVDAEARVLQAAKGRGFMRASFLLSADWHSGRARGKFEYTAPQSSVGEVR